MSKLDWLITGGLGPVLVLQGKYVRFRTQKLPEPPGERIGSLPAIAAQPAAVPLRLLVLGDSAAAGVGAEHQDEALLGQLLSRLSSQHALQWRLHAMTGATTATTLNSMPLLRDSQFDAVVVSLGVNDLTSGLPVNQWLEHYAELRDVLRERHGVTQLVLSSLPPMDLFPALPQPLRWYMGRKARQFNQALEYSVRHEPDCCFLDLEFSRAATTMAPDGFHPGPEIYAMWGERASEVLTRNG